MSNPVTESHDADVNPPWMNPAISVERDPNNNLRLTIWTDIVAGEAERLVLSPDHAASFLRDLTQQVTYSLLGAAESIALGDCATCRNTRFAKTVDRGRESNEHCPSCTTPETRARTFPERPQIGGGMA